ncbi:Imm32 family immunity protein [Streptomyces olivoreticuli]|uniref:Imm32 family immunity protein n=1 Tax=Streptomyces olivoreticuli TaxID=68246 RepID=UPI0013C2E7A2|nr:hypothetical protein [Streptomyces olivoreticuli]
MSAKMVSAVDTAITAVSEFAQTAAPYLKAAWDFTAEVTGINDAVACATKGDVEACLWTAVTVASIFVPGSTGAVRGAKAVRMAGKLEHAAAGGTCPVPNSFTPETLVVMADGSTKPIKDIQIGEKVLATDPTTGRTEARPMCRREPRWLEVLGENIEQFGAKSLPSDHLHIEYFPDHYYLAPDSTSLVVCLLG